MSDPFARLHTDLSEMSAGLGFVEVEPPDLEEQEEAPERVSAWRNSFATLLVVPVTRLDEETLSRTMAAGEAWLREHIDAEEMQGRLIDGYLLIASSRQPSETVASAVGRIEQNPYTCRKHVLWPEDDGSWRRRLLGVTTLSLPDPPPAVRVAAEANLPLVAERVLELYRGSKSTEEAVGKIRAYAAQTAAERIRAG